MGNSIEKNLEIKPKEYHLLHAAECGDLEKLLELIKYDRIPVDVTNSSALTPLFLAAKEGHSEIVNILIQLGANVDGVVDGSQVWTPLWVAAYAGNSKCVKLLVEAGASLMTKYPETPLYVSAREGRPDCLKHLIEAGASVNLTDEKQKTPLHLACESLNTRCIKLLLTVVEDPNVYDAFGHTPLYHLCAEAPDNHTAMQVLVCSGVSLNIPCQLSDKLSPLHICVERRLLQSCKLLLKYGMSVWLKNKAGRSVKDIASEFPVESQEFKNLIDGYSGPQRLTNLCCWCIRKALGPKRLKRIHELPLSHILKQALL